MPLLTSGQPPSQAPQSAKRRKVVPTIDRETLEHINRFPYLLIYMTSDDPDVQSLALQKLTALSPLMQQLALSQSSESVHCAAEKFRSLSEACTVLQVTYNPYGHLWDRDDVDQDPPATLSSDVDSVVQRLQKSGYHEIDYSETSIRVIVELVILDRLQHLSDKGALEQLYLYPEVDVELYLGETLVTGRADWLLCHDDPRHGIDSSLLAIEAKRSAEFSRADSQIATDLAAIQSSRANAPKLHQVAFGITTDSRQYRFWYVDSEKRLFSSVVFDWRLHKARIITWIDKMLAEAIEASPLTTPILRRNTSLCNWEKDFRRRRLLSSISDDSPVTEGRPLDIYLPPSSRFVRHAWHQNRRVMVFECEESSADDEDEESRASCSC